ncbi:DUF4244 domain-containing protein [Kitasatospora sp. NPDC097605]|uniref:DUF4244 domain-containing protein n=1 Tax=Kitasatospora sp. NPDC097605 TaxID=3157226 RepID=UPI00331BAE50
MNVAIKSVRGAAVGAAVGAAFGAVRRVRPAIGPAIRRRIRARGGSDAGMSTAEYAVGTLGACALGAALYKVATSAAVFEALSGALDRALHVA